jgi:hypothetical protein
MNDVDEEVFLRVTLPTFLWRDWRKLRLTSELPISGQDLKRVLRNMKEGATCKIMIFGYGQSCAYSPVTFIVPDCPLIRIKQLENR